MSARLDPGRAALVVVDVQDGFRPAIPGFDRIAAAAATMVRGAAAMDVPIVVTEQYPKGLGPTVPEVAEHLPDGVEPLAKTAFSAASADGFALGGREQAIVCGIEVHVVTDAVGSRSPADRELGIAKAERAGAWPTSVETALFELLGDAGSDRFKQVQGLVLEYAP